MNAFSTILSLCLCLDAPPVTSECICAAAKVQNGWCEPCKVGYVAGLRIPSKLLFSTIDHGHVVESGNLRCDSCKQALETDGYCEKCQMGFFHQKLYLSYFTYTMARGQRITAEQVTCTTCRNHMEEGGWCDACSRGIFGNIMTVERKGFDEAVRAFRRLRLALNHLDQCEICAVAIYANGMCPKCRLVYEDGKAKSEGGPAK